MQPRILKHIEDIRDAVPFILEVVQGRTLTDYDRDRLFRQAIERNFEIIGEAVGRLVKESPETALRISNYQNIIAFRNVLAHGYDIIESAQVWTIIQEHLPRLRQNVDELVKGNRAN